MSCEFDLHGVSCDLCQAEAILIDLTQSVEGDEYDPMLAQHIRHYEESFSLGVNREVAVSLAESPYAELDEFHCPETFTAQHSNVNLVYAQESLVGAIFGGLGAILKAAFLMVASVFSGIGKLIGWIFGGSVLSSTAKSAGGAAKTIGELPEPEKLWHETSDPKEKAALEELKKSYVVFTATVATKNLSAVDFAKSFDKQLDDSKNLVSAVDNILASLDLLNGKSIDNRKVASVAKAINSEIDNIITGLNNYFDEYNLKTVNTDLADTNNKIEMDRQIKEGMRVINLPKTSKDFIAGLEVIKKFTETLDEKKVSGKIGTFNQYAKTMKEQAGKLDEFVGSQGSIDKKIKRQVKDSCLRLKKVLNLFASAIIHGGRLSQKTVDSNRKYSARADAFAKLVLKSQKKDENESK